ncbi:MAG: hypothetical protein JST00_46160 [Deltaproteobacteria bacterium]|nr:hypothetical protein [Deltaproteobacteria bacterium]
MGAFRRAHLWLGFSILVLVGINFVALFYAASPPLPLLATLALAVVARVFTGRTLAKANAAANADVSAADDLTDSDPEKAMELARRALTGGATGDARVLGWLVAARIHENIGAFDKANEAVDLAIGRAAKMALDAALLDRLRLQIAFVKAAVGDVETAKASLDAVHRHKLSDPVSTADYARARALIAYRRGEHAEVIDIVSQELGEGAVDRPRDVALLEQLRASSRLRLEGNGPLRVASDPSGDTMPSDEEWVSALVAEPERTVEEAPEDAPAA